MATPDAHPASSLPLKSLPADELPREKLMRHGRASLTDEELIAIFLRTGLHGCNVLELAAHLKRSAGSLAGLGRLEASDISQLCKGIGPAKAATLAAVFELGHRAAREAKKEAVLNSADAIYDFMVDELRFEQQERMFVLLLNARHELIRKVEIGLGTLTRLVVHPRDVYSQAVRYNASCIALVHNHPSGHPEPSTQDVYLTQSLVKASDFMGIPLMDHIIIGASSKRHEKPYFSFRDNDMLVPAP